MNKIVLFVILMCSIIHSEGVIPLDEIRRPLIYPEGTWLLNGKGSGSFDKNAAHAEGLLEIAIPNPTYSITSKLSYTVSMFRYAFIQNTSLDSSHHVQILNGPSLVCDMGILNLSYSTNESPFSELEYVYVYYGVGMKTKIPLNRSIWIEPELHIEAKNVDGILPSAGLLVGYQLFKQLSFTISHTLKLLYPTRYNSFPRYPQIFHMYNSTIISGTMGLNQALSIGCYIGLKTDNVDRFWFPFGINLDFGWQKTE